MKFKFLSVLVLLLPWLTNATTIAVGYYSKHAKIWRFYERNSKGQFEPKVLVYNTTGQPITMCMKVVQHGSDMDARAMGLLKEYTGLTSDTVIPFGYIPPHSSGIYAAEQLLTDKSTGFYDAIFINGERIGIERIRPKLEVKKAKYKYYSWEGLGGAESCLIGTNELMLRAGEEGQMTLYFKNVRKQRESYPVSEWTFDMELLKGDAIWSISQPGGATASVTPEQSKRSFAVNVSEMDAFELKMSYKLGTDRTSPEFQLRRHFCNGCSNVMSLPVLLKKK